MDTLGMHSSLHRRRFLTSTAAVLALPFPPAQDTPLKIDIHVDPSRVLGPVLNDFLGFGYEISSVAVQGLLSPATERCSSTPKSRARRGRPHWWKHCRFFQVVSRWPAAFGTESNS